MGDLVGDLSGSLVVALHHFAPPFFVFDVDCGCPSPVFVRVLSGTFNTSPSFFVGIFP